MSSRNEHKDLEIFSKARPPGWTFGRFRVEPSEGRLLRDGVPLALTPKAFELLVVLLSRHGRLVTRDELFSTLWPETFVADGNLAGTVWAIRKALGKRDRWIETVPKRGYRFVGAVNETPHVPDRERQTGRRIESIGVLPLVNLSGDAEQDYFVDGMTDAVIAELAQIAALKVMSRTTMMRFKGTRMAVTQIAQELNVDGLVEGSVLLVGDRVRITAQLIHATTDAHLWAEQYERPLCDVLALQSDVARAIAASLEIELTSLELVRRARPRVHPAAYEAYLRGRHHWARVTDDGFLRARDYLTRAVALEPTFALAHAALADVYIALAAFGSIAAQEGFSLAENAAQHALELDPALGAAHRALGLVRMSSWDWPGAEASFERALASEAGSAEVRSHYSLYLIARGRCAEAVASAEHARVIDPLSLMINNDLAFALWAARRYAEAIDRYQQTLELDQNFIESRRELGLLYASTGNLDAALPELERAAAHAKDRETLACLGYGLARAGRLHEAHTILTDVARASSGRHVDSSAEALVYLGLGDLDAALGALERAYEQRSWQLVWLRSWPVFDPLRSVPRFAGLIQDLGLA